MPERYIIPSAPYLGEVSHRVYVLLGGILESRSYNQLERRMALRTPEPILPLSQLAQDLEDEAVDFDQASKPFRFPPRLGYNRTWPILLAAVNSLICEQYLKKSGLLGESRLVTAEEIDEVIRKKIPTRTINRLGIDTSVTPITIRSTNSDITLTQPDSLAIKETGHRRATVEDYFMYRFSTTPFIGAYRIDQLRKIVQIERSREAVQLAIGLIIFGDNAINPNHLFLPPPAVLKPKLVAAYQDAPRYLLGDQFSGILCAQIPSRVNMDSISLFFLRLQTGMTPQQERWQDYFAKVEPPVNLT